MAGRVVLKRYGAVVDLKSTLPLPEFELVAGDTGNVLELDIKDGGTAVSVEGMYVTAVFSGSGATVLQDSSDGSVTLAGSRVTIRLAPAAAMPGHVSCELQLYTSSLDEPSSREDYDVLVTTARFGFDCREPMLNEGAVAALPETPLLTALIAGVEQAEAERQAAEQQRAEAFEAMMAAAGGGSLTGQGAPASTIRASAGMLYFDTVGKRLYFCTDAANGTTWAELLPVDGSANSLKVQRISTYTFANLPYNSRFSLQELIARLAGWYPVIDGKQDALTFDSAPQAASANPVTSGGVYSALHAGDWTTLADLTLDGDKASFELNARGSAYGGGAFSYDELRLYLIGSMTGGTSARVYINGGTDRYMQFSNLCLSDPTDPEECCTCLYFKKPVCGFAFAERTTGGDAEDEGRSASSTLHAACLKVNGLQKYAGVKLSGNTASIKFASGMRVVLMGRNT